MKVYRYEAHMVGDLTSAYNRAIRGVPHCYKVSRRDFEKAVSAAVGGEPDRHRHSEAIFVALERGAIEGFIHVAVGPPWRRGKKEEGLIRFFWYRPGARRIGAALLDTAEEYLRGHKAKKMSAFFQHHNYRFYHLGSAHLSDHLDHVGALLALNGYERVEGEVFLNWRDYEVAKGKLADARLRFRVERPKGRAKLPGVFVRALRGKKEIGVCKCKSVGEYSRARQAQNWLFTDWLGVNERFQGKGIGWALLQRALWEGRRLGYRHAAISTARDNHRALPSLKDTKASTEKTYYDGGKTQPKTLAEFRVDAQGHKFLHGKLVKYYANGLRKYEQRYVQGKAHGLQRWWREDGTLLRIHAQVMGEVVSYEKYALSVGKEELTDEERALLQKN